MPSKRSKNLETPRLSFKNVAPGTLFQRALSSLIPSSRAKMSILMAGAAALTAIFAAKHANAFDLAMALDLPADTEQRRKKMDPEAFERYLDEILAEEFCNDPDALMKHIQQFDAANPEEFTHTTKPEGAEGIWCIDLLDEEQKAQIRDFIAEAKGETEPEEEEEVVVAAPITEEVVIEPNKDVGIIDKVTPQEEAGVKVAVLEDKPEEEDEAEPEEEEVNVIVPEPKPKPGEKVITYEDMQNSKPPYRPPAPGQMQKHRPGMHDGDGNGGENGEGGNGEGDDQESLPTFTIIPALPGYYSADDFEEFDPNTLEWINRSKPLTGFGNSWNQEDKKYLITGRIKAFRRSPLPLPEGHEPERRAKGLSLASVHRNGKLVTEKDVLSDGAYLLNNKLVVDQDFSISFWKRRTPEYQPRIVGGRLEMLTHVGNIRFSEQTLEFIDSIASLSPKEKAEAIVDYLLNTVGIRYSTKRKHDPINHIDDLRDYFLHLESPEGRKGDCDVVNAFVSLLLRKAGVPSKLQAGGVGVQKNGVTNLDINHAWTEFWNGEKWVAIDGTPYILYEDPEVIANRAFRESLRDGTYAGPGAHSDPRFYKLWEDRLPLRTYIHILGMEDEDYRRIFRSTGTANTPFGKIDPSCKGVTINGGRCLNFKDIMVALQYFREDLESEAKHLNWDSGYVFVKGHLIDEYSFHAFRKTIPALKSRYSQWTPELLREIFDASGMDMDEALAFLDGIS